MPYLSLTKYLHNRTHLICLLLIVLTCGWLFSRKKCPAGNQSPQPTKFKCPKPRFAAYGNKKEDLDIMSNMFELAGMEEINITRHWDLLWVLYLKEQHVSSLMKLARKQAKINRIPGFDRLTKKVELMTQDLPGIPPAFRIPRDLDKLKKFSQENPSAKFLRKRNDHHGIEMMGLDRIDQLDREAFIQYYVEDPLLSDGHRFDLGLYVVVTSVNPMRAYVYEEEVLLKYCSESYHPFDPTNKNKYLVDNNYNRYNIPGYDKYFKKLGLSNKEYLNEYIRSTHHKSAETLWQNVDRVIAGILLHFDPVLAEQMSGFPFKRSFFEVFRADFVVKSNLDVFLVEFERTPYFKALGNHALYQRLVHSLLPLVTSSTLHGGVWCNTRDSKQNRQQLPANFDHVLPEVCGQSPCVDSCKEQTCHLCKPCLTADDKEVIRQATLERRSRHLFRRIVPAPVTGREDGSLRELLFKGYDEWTAAQMSVNNWKMRRWYQGKCLLDQRWCD